MAILEYPDVFNHPSKKKNKVFQRLEFLGDSLINKEISILLYRMYPNYNEGDLTIKRSNMVNKFTLSKIGSLLLPYINYQGDLNDEIISSTLEAYIGAYFLDNKDIAELIYDLWKDYLILPIQQDIKILVQHFFHKKNILFKYEYMFRTQYICLLKYKNKYYQGTGISKKIASENCARSFYYQIISKTP